MIWFRTAFRLVKLIFQRCRDGWLRFFFFLVQNTCNAIMLPWTQVSFNPCGQSFSCQCCTPRTLGATPLELQNIIYNFKPFWHLSTGMWVLPRLATCLRAPWYRWGRSWVLRFLCDLPVLSRHQVIPNFVLLLRPMSCVPQRWLTHIWAVQPWLSCVLLFCFCPAGAPQVIRTTLCNRVTRNFWVSAAERSNIYS